MNWVSHTIKHERCSCRPRKAKTAGNACNERDRRARISCRTGLPLGKYSCGLVVVYRIACETHVSASCCRDSCHRTIADVGVGDPNVLVKEEPYSRLFIMQAAIPIQDAMRNANMPSIDKIKPVAESQRRFSIESDSSVIGRVKTRDRYVGRANVILV